MQVFAIKGRQMNAYKVEIKFWRDNNVVASVVFIDDAPNKQTIIRWYDHRYYTIPYHSQLLYAKPYRMTLAKYKQLNGNLAK